VPRRVLSGIAGVVAIIGVLAAPAHAAPGDIFTFAGTGAAGFGGDGGPATAAALHQPTGLARLADGSILVADYANHRIRRVSPNGQITTVAGTNTTGYSGDGGQATAARLNLPTDVEPTPDGGFLIADYGNRRVRKVSPAGVITTVAGTGVSGTYGNGGPATSAQLGAPTGVAVTADGGFLIADAAAHRIRRVSPGGIITSVAGTGTAGGSGDGGPATAARLNAPVSVAALAGGGFLVAEYEGHRVRRVSAAGVITRVAGTGTAGFSGDGEAALAARLNYPVHVSPTSDGGLLIGDSANDRVRKVSPDGTIATVAGTGEAGFAGDGGPAMLARLDAPYAAVEDGSGGILIADGQNNRLRRVEGPAPAVVEVPPSFPGLPVLQLRAHAGVVQATTRAVRFPVVCPVTATATCRGTIRLVVRARKAAAARRVVLARGRFAVRAGDSKLVKVPLTRAGRRLLRKRRAVTVTAVVARRGGPNIRNSSERSTVRVKRKRSRGRAAGTVG
jgi:hypothetical protein